MTAGVKNKIDDAVMKVICWDFQPFSVVEDRGFKNLLNTCAPSYDIPSRKYFANTLLPALHEKKKNEIKEELQSVKSVCLTTDSWTSPTNDSYTAVTAHYINENLEMKSIALECAVSDFAHTSRNLADDLSRVINEWELSNKVAMVTTDNANNISGAITLLKYKQFGCYAHKLNLIVQDSLKECISKDVNGLIKKVKSIVTYFKRSNADCRRLVQFQEQSGCKQPKKLLQDVVTRWNSTYFMLERLILLKDAVKHTIAFIDSGLEPLTPEEWNICEQLCELLEPFYEVTKEISAEKYLTASKVIPITHALKTALTKLSPTHKEVKAVWNSLLEGMNKRFPLLENSRTLCLCTFLDPRYKHHLFQLPSTADTTKKQVIELVTGLINLKKTDTDDKSKKADQPPSEPPAKKAKRSIWDDIDITISKVQPSTSATAQAIIEVQRYMEEPPVSRKNGPHPLQWWRENLHLYPNLANVVKNKCHIVATSTPCERMFSKAGCIISERRTRLATKKEKELMFLNMNI